MGFSSDGQTSPWWPPSVPHRRLHADARADGDTKPHNDQNEAVLVPPRSRLCMESNHFRLAYLTESGHFYSSIHVRLEEYALDDPPEYGTVSYAWGGEHGDSILCERVIFGPFWDIPLPGPRQACQVI